MQTPLSIGQVLDAGFMLYRRAFKATVPLTLLASVLGILPMLIMGPQLSLAALKPGYFALIFIFSLFGMVVFGAVFARLDDVASGRNQLGFIAAIRRGVAKFLPLFGAGIIYGIAVMIGLLLLIVPGVWLSIALAFALNAVILDNVGVIDSFDVSRKLVAGNWWRVVVILSVAFAILMAITAGVGLLAGLTLPFSRIVQASNGVAVPNTVGLVVFQLINGAVSAMISPLIYAMSYCIYRDLQVRKSGGDLAERIAAGV